MIFVSWDKTPVRRMERPVVLQQHLCHCSFGLLYMSAVHDVESADFSAVALPSYVYHVSPHQSVMSHCLWSTKGTQVANNISPRACNGGMFFRNEIPAWGDDSSGFVPYYLICLFGLMMAVLVISWNIRGIHDPLKRAMVSSPLRFWNIYLLFVPYRRPALQVTL